MLANTPPPSGLAIIDWVIVAVYATSTIVLGWWFGRKQESTKEYFTGSGNMNWMLIGVSLFATLLSTISYLSMPGEILGKGPIYLTNLIAYPFIFLFVGYVIIPTYMKYRVTSAYELLEDKLGLGIRLLGVTMFLVLRLTWMSLLVYLAAKAMIVMIGVDESWIPYIVLTTGLVSVIYTTLGGLRAVVVTDLIQTILLFGGALTVIAMITIDFGGFGWFPTEWHQNWDKQPILSFDPSTRITVIGTILCVFIWYACTSGGDQVSIQRFMATKDASSARKALATQLVVGAFVGVTLGLVGMALLGFFQAHPESLPNGMSLKENSDAIFPRYIAFHLPPGVSGIVIAAMFAAAMSSIDSGVNSITAVVTTDIFDRFGYSPKTEKGHIRLARILAFSIGAFIVFFSPVMGKISGNITTMAGKTVNLFVPLIFCLFFFALFVKFSKPAGVWAGWLCGLITAILIAFSGSIFGVDPETGYDPISFQWTGPAALLVNLTVGLGVSYLLSRSDKTANE
ncbi:MAG: sodium/solute symporter [Verrucomicrobiales bacterium]|nr:sodium/solute symporter [Verrucomicrobiales bacterium]